MLYDGLQRDDFLYGGSLDIALGGSGQIPLDLIRASALFYDAIVVPDSFFVCEGPLFSHLYGIFRDLKSTDTNDEILTYLRRGIIRPSLRSGESIADVWFGGSEMGVEPGRYLIAPAALGDPIFRALQTYRIPFLTWPDDMRSAKTTDFGRRLEEIFLDNSGAMNLVEAEALIRTTYREHVPGWGPSEVRQTGALLESFSRLLEENRTNPTFRRGQIEDLIARELKWDTRFSYDQLSASKTRDMPHAMAASLMKSVATVYELYQADKFGYIPQLCLSHNPIISTEYVDPNHKAETEFSVLVFDLCADIDVRRLEPVDVLAARDLRTVGGDSFLERAIELRRAGLYHGGSDLVEFISFCTEEYIPKLRETFPKVRSSPIETTVRSSLQTMSDAAALGSASTSAVLWLLGGTPIAASLGLDALAKWISSAPAVAIGAGATSIGIRTIKRGTAAADRWLTAHQSRTAASRLTKEVNNLVAGPSN